MLTTLGPKYYNNHYSNRKNVLIFRTHKETILYCITWTQVLMECIHINSYFILILSKLRYRTIHCKLIFKIFSVNIFVKNIFTEYFYNVHCPIDQQKIKIRTIPQFTLPIQKMIQPQKKQT